MKDKLEDLRLELKNALDQTKDDQQSRPERCGQIADLLLEELSACECALSPPTRITAKRVRLLVTDEATGRLHVRVLPIEYLENHNGITLTGENIAAQQVKMAFLSAGAVERLAELQGSGPEKPRCNHD